MSSFDYSNLSDPTWEEHFNKDFNETNERIEKNREEIERKSKEFEEKYRNSEKEMEASRKEFDEKWNSPDWKTDTTSGSGHSSSSSSSSSNHDSGNSSSSNHDSGNSSSSSSSSSSNHNSGNSSSSSSSSSSNHNSDNSSSSSSSSISNYNSGNSSSSSSSISNSNSGNGGDNKSSTSRTSINNPTNYEIGKSNNNNDAAYISSNSSNNNSTITSKGETSNNKSNGNNNEENNSPVIGLLILVVIGIVCAAFFIRKRRKRASLYQDDDDADIKITTTFNDFSTYENVSINPSNTVNSGNTSFQNGESIVNAGTVTNVTIQTDDAQSTFTNISQHQSGNMPSTYGASSSDTVPLTTAVQNSPYQDHTTNPVPPSIVGGIPNVYQDQKSNPNTTANLTVPVAIPVSPQPQVYSPYVIQPLSPFYQVPTTYNPTTPILDDKKVSPGVTPMDAIPVASSTYVNAIPMASTSYANSSPYVDAKSSLMKEAITPNYGEAGTSSVATITTAPPFQPYNALPIGNTPYINPQLKSGNEIQAKIENTTHQAYQASASFALPYAASPMIDVQSSSAIPQVSGTTANTSSNNEKAKKSHQ